MNKLQIDGISFIEHISYNAFNEGTRLINCMAIHWNLFGEFTHYSADEIYATNANRTDCSQNKITTNFVPKGKQKAGHQDQNKVIRTLQNKERGTRLEGSFGNEKNL